MPVLAREQGSAQRGRADSDKAVANLPAPLDPDLQPPDRTPVNQLGDMNGR